MLRCELRIQRSLTGKPLSHCSGVPKRLARPRLGRFDIRVSSIAKDRLEQSDALSKHKVAKEAQDILDWLSRNEEACGFTLLGDKGSSKLSDVLEKLKKFKGLSDLVKHDETKPDKNFLVSLMNKVYTKMLRRERQSFAEAFDKAASEVLQAAIVWQGVDSFAFTSC